MIRATHLDCWGLAVDCGDLYRVRWFRARDGLVPVPAGTDPAAACVEAAGTDRSLLATVEADGGAGPVVYLAAGGAGVVWDTETVDSATDIVLRMWEVEGAGEVTAPSGLPELVLGEVVEAEIVLNAPDASIENLSHFCREHLASYKIPTRFPPGTPSASRSFPFSNAGIIWGWRLNSSAAAIQKW